MQAVKNPNQSKRDTRYAICARAVLSGGIRYKDGVAIRRCATEDNITMPASIAAVKALWDVETKTGVSTIDS